MILELWKISEKLSREKRKLWMLFMRVFLHFAQAQKHKSCATHATHCVSSLQFFLHFFPEIITTMSWSSYVTSPKLCVVPHALSTMSWFALFNQSMKYLIVSIGYLIPRRSLDTFLWRRRKVVFYFYFPKRISSALG